jgi:hypothetical protein
VIDGVFTAGEDGQVHFAKAVVLTPHKTLRRSNSRGALACAALVSPSSKAHPLVIALQMAAFGP